MSLERRQDVIGPAKECKIFGIGLGKTGTTSLHFALEMLGFRSAHASTLFCELINEEARSHQALLSTLAHDYDAFIDWPISYLYRQLDRRFPGSKFVLTVRNVADRYRSARRHVELDQFRRARGLSHAWIDLESEDKFVSEDRCHTASVHRYFRNRSNDFLVMDITQGEGWEVLSPFLNVSIPTESFPHHRATASYDSHFMRSSAIEPHVTSVDLGAWRARS